MTKTKKWGWSDSEDSESDTEPPQNTCSYCGITFANELSQKYRDHLEKCIHKRDVEKLETADGTKKYLCSICAQGFKYMSGLTKHEKRHISPGGFICTLCQMHFVSDFLRNLHKEKIHKVYKCQICHNKFSSEVEYTTHINEFHDGKDRVYVVCTDCGHQFRTPVQLKNHNLSKCGTHKTFTCDECDSTFMTQATLKAHKLIHTGEKKHLCNYCGNCFLSKGQLKVHERCHTKEKPFKCTECDKAFSYRESLVTHSSVHTGIKPFFCDCCKKTFSCIGNLIKHRRTRTNTCGRPEFCKNTKIAPRARPPKTIADEKTKALFKIEPINKTVDIIKNYVLNVAKEKSEILTKDIRKAKKPNKPNNLNIQSSTGQYNQYLKKEELENEELISIVESVENVEVSFKNVEMVSSTKKEISVSEEILESDNLFCYVSLDAAEVNSPYEETNWDNDVCGDEDDNNENYDIILNPQDAVYTIVEIEANDINPEKNNTNFTEKPAEVSDNDLDKNVAKLEKHISDHNESEFINFDFQPKEEYEDTPANIVIEKMDTSYESSDNSGNVEILSLKEKIEKPFKCEKCPKAFSQHKQLQKHDLQIHCIKIVQNDDCEKNSETTKCRYCTKIFKNMLSLEKHQILHGDDGHLVHKCSCCPEYFSTPEVLTTHQREKHVDELFCIHCGKFSKYPDKLKMHINYAHKKTVKVKKYCYICPNCGKNFNSKVALSDHERSNCGKTPVYKCHICDKRYHSAGSLKTHQTIHTGALPHLCKFCGKAFRTQGQVKVHERQHNGEKPYKCEFCPKSFAYRESLLTHRSLHTGLKRFMCQTCNARFSCISNLQAHRKSSKRRCGAEPMCTKPIGPMGVNETTLFSTTVTK